MSSPKYKDPVARDMFTALDVSLVIPLVHFVEGIQSDKAKARLAVLSFVTSIASGLVVVYLYSITAGLFVAGVVAGTAYLAQLGYALRRKRISAVSSRPATWLASTVSIVHYITAINLIGHAELGNDFFIKLVVVVIYVVHALAGLAIIFMLTTMVPLNQAWGCYPQGLTLSELNMGPCGEDPSLSWVNPNPQAICRDPRVWDNIDGPCTPRHSAEQSFGPALAFAFHAEAVALVAYTIGCVHAFTVYFSDLASLPPAAKKVSTSMLFWTDSGSPTFVLQ